MNKWLNGNIVEMTPEEIAAWEQSIADTPAPEQTTEERLADLEASNAELREALDLILSGGTE